MRPTPRWWRAALLTGVVLVALAIGYVALGSPLKAAIRGVANPGPSSAFGMRWTPGLLVFTVDGREWTRVEGAQVPSEPMTLARRSQSWNCGRGWAACPDSTTPPRVDLQIDWAVRYAWTG